MGTFRRAASVSLLLLLCVLPAQGGDFDFSSLNLTKSDSAEPVAVGGTIDYTISVINQGGDPAPALTITDNLPAGTGFVSVNAPGFSPCSTPAAGTAGPVVCTLPFNLAVGSSVSITIRVAVTASAPPTLNNTATVTSSKTDPDPSNNTDTETTTVTGGQSGSDVPTMSGWMLILLAASLGLAGVFVFKN